MAYQEVRKVTIVGSDGITPVPGVGGLPSALSTNQFTVHSTAAGAAIVVPADVASAGVVIKASGNTNYWLGDSTVTVSNGFLMSPGDVLSLKGNYAVYAVDAAGTGTGSYLMEKI